MLYLLGGLAALGALGAVTGWIAAFRARGESRDALGTANKAAERARIAEARADAAEAKAANADSNAAAAGVELKAAKASEAVALSSLKRERQEKANLLADLAKRGVAVGGSIVDASIDKLFPDDHENSRGPGDPVENKDRGGREMSDDTPTNPGKPTP